MEKMLMFIGHLVKDDKIYLSILCFFINFLACISSYLVANEITEIKKSIKEIKVDIVKNQELLISLTDRANHSATQSEEKVPLYRSNLKVPVSNIDDLHKLESNEEQKQILVCFNCYFISYKNLIILFSSI